MFLNCWIVSVHVSNIALNVLTTYIRTIPTNFGGFINRKFSYKLKLVVENYSWLLSSVHQEVTPK